MKKIIFFIIASMIVFVSCIINTSSESYMDEAIQGAWYFNKNIIRFEEDSFIITDQLYERINKGTFKINPIPDEPPHWIWEDVSNFEHSIHWVDQYNNEGNMVYIKHLKDNKSETIVVKGTPCGQNEKFDTLIRIY